MANEQGKNIFSYTPDKAVKIIFDTDMDTDVDDTGALAVLYSYAQEGRAEVLATVGSCNSGHAVKCIGGINAYYGFPKVPVGISPKCPSSGKSPYQSVIAEKYGKDYPDDKAARPALEVYREVLSSAEDNSVVITVIGALNNLSDLLRSQGDKYSPLNGIELVNRKVKLCIIMGGRFPESAPGGEYNINLDVDAAYYVIHNCPISILWSGQEIGEAIFTGDMRNEMEEDDPVRLAYDLYGNDKTSSYKRQSWDLTTILFAVEGAKDYWDIQTGTVEINTAGHLLNADFAPAYNNWIAGEGKDARLIQKASPQTLAEILNRRMVTVRKGKSTVSQSQPHREKGERMKKIGIFLDEIKDENIDEKQKFAKLGYNTGNLLFWHSLKTNLGLDVRSRWYIDHIDQLDLNEYKAFVTTDLIWIRQMQDFSYLNKVLDVIGTLPLVPISVGLQCNSYLPDFKLHPETLKVLQRISERCVMGVRGSYTAEILSKYGITNFKIIGCPSMYMDTPGFESVNNSGTAPKRISLNFETFYGKLTKPKTDLLQYGERHDFEFVEQVQATPEAKHIPDEAALKEILGWLDRKRHCFFDIGQWREYMNGVDFSLGTRFHGNVLALWEGVPALFFTCDSRTKELCEHFSLPRMDISEFDPEKSIEYYYEKADYSEFHKQYPQRLKEWNEFLEMNGLLDDDCQRPAGSDVLKPSDDLSSTVSELTKFIYPDGSPRDGENVIIALNHISGLFQAVALKFTVYRNCNVTLLVQNKDFTVTEFAANLIKNGVFVNIIAYIDYFHFTAFSTEPITKDDYNNLEPEDWQSAITLYFDRLFEANKIKLGDFPHIITSCDVNNNFYLYCVFNSRKMIFMEFQEGQIADENRYIINSECHKGSVKLEELNRKYRALTGDSDSVIKRLLCSKEKYLKINDKDIGINFLTLFYSISGDDRKKIKNSINNEGQDYTNINILILNSLGWSEPKTGLKIPYHYYPYFLIGDYYFNNSPVVFKDHPQVSGLLMNEYLAGTAEIIGKNIPIEFYGLTENFHVSRIVTVSSTGSSKIEQFVSENVSLGGNYLVSYKIIHKLYAAFLADELTFSPTRRYHIHRINKDFISLFKKYVFKPFPQDNPRGINPRILRGEIFTVIGELPLQDRESIEYALKNADNKTCVVFLDDQLSRLDDLALLEYFVPIEIKKEKLREKILCDTETEYIYFFCKDEKLRNCLNALDHEKTLRYSGIKLHIKADFSGKLIMQTQAHKLSEQLHRLTAKADALENWSKKLQ